MAVKYLKETKEGKAFRLAMSKNPDLLKQYRAEKKIKKFGGIISNKLSADAQVQKELEEIKKEDIIENQEKPKPEIQTVQNKPVEFKPIIQQPYATINKNAVIQNQIPRNQSTQESSVPQKYKNFGLPTKPQQSVYSKVEKPKGTFESLFYNAEQNLNELKFNRAREKISGQTSSFSPSALKYASTSALIGVGAGATAFTKNTIEFVKDPTYVLRNPNQAVEGVIGGVKKSISDIKFNPAYGIAKVGTETAGSIALGKLSSTATRAMGFKPIREKLPQLKAEKVISKGTIGIKLTENTIKTPTKILTNIDNIESIKLGSQVGQGVRQSVNKITVQSPSRVIKGTNIFTSKKLKNPIIESSTTVGDITTLSSVQKVPRPLGLGSDEVFVRTTIKGRTATTKLYDPKLRNNKPIDVFKTKVPKPIPLLESTKLFSKEEKLGFNNIGIRQKNELYIQKGLTKPKDYFAIETKTSATQKATASSLMEYTDINTKIIDLESGKINQITKTEGVRTIPQKVQFVESKPTKDFNIYTQKDNKIFQRIGGEVDQTNILKMQSSYTGRFDLTKTKTKPIKKSIQEIKSNSDFLKKLELDLTKSEMRNSLESIKSSANKINNNLILETEKVKQVQTVNLPAPKFDKLSFRQPTTFNFKTSQTNIPVFFTETIEETRKIPTTENILETNTQKSNDFIKTPTITQIKQSSLILESETKKIPRNDFKQEQNTRYINKTANLLKIDTKKKQDIIKIQKSQIEQQLVNTNVPTIINKFLKKTKPIPIIRFTPKFTPILLPKFQNLKKNNKRFNLFAGFGVKVKRKGKYRTLFTGLTQSEAIRAGQRYTDVTTARSFKIFKSGTVKREKTGAVDLLRYRRGKRDPFAFVEKSKFAISTGGEKGELRKSRNRWF